MSETVGFIGLGKMGLPMAVNLLKSGYTVFGNDVNPSAISELQLYGGTNAKLTEWIHKVSHIILMLPSSSIVNQVINEILDSYDNVKTSDKPLAIIDMSSSYPADTKQNDTKLREKNIGFIDAPVSGGVQKAISASLTIMAGGSEKDFEKCKRLLNCLGTNIFHTGPIGSGHLMKAVNNYLSATHLLASCEAIELLKAHDVNPETAINVFNQSTGRSGSTEYKFPSFILTESYDSGFSLELLRKDVSMAHQLFTDSEANTILPGIVSRKYSEAGSELSRDADHTEIYRHVSKYLLKKGISNEKPKEAISSNINTSINI